MELTGSFFDYLIVFSSGVLMSFTPCIYPLIPITAGFIAGADTEGTKMSGFIISLVYVFGISMTYSFLAIFASLTGKIFGQFQNHPFSYLISSVLLIVFSFVLFDIIPLQTIDLGNKKRKKPKNLWAVFIFGISSGLIMGSCSTPILGSLLLYMASKHNILHSVSLMFAFSFGVGFSLILIGTFSSILSVMPKSGIWHLRIKHFCGAVLLASGVYFLIKAIIKLKLMGII